MMGHNQEFICELGPDLRKYSLGRPLWSGSIWMKWKNESHNLGAEHDGKSKCGDIKVQTAGSFERTEEDGMNGEKQEGL